MPQVIFLAISESGNIVLNILVTDWFELWEWWLTVVCRAQIISPFLHCSAVVKGFKLVIVGRIIVDEGEVIIVEVSKAFEDEEAMSTALSCSTDDVELVVSELIGDAVFLN